MEYLRVNTNELQCNDLFFGSLITILRYRPIILKSKQNSMWDDLEIFYQEFYSIVDENFWRIHHQYKSLKSETGGGQDQMPGKIENVYWNWAMFMWK